MKKNKKMLNEDELLSIKAGKCIHTSLGRLLHKIRIISPQSHEVTAEKTTICSGTAWRLENRRNYSVVSCLQAFHTHFTALGSKFLLNRLCQNIEKVQSQGMSIVVNIVKYEELSNYDQKSIIFVQQPPSEEEMARRIRQQEAILAKNRKLGINKWKKAMKKKEEDHKKKTKKR